MLHPKQRPLTIITSFSGEYAFLSNFFTCDIYYHNILYKTVEHAYQAAKCAVLLDKIIIRDAPTAGKAKYLGKQVDMVPDFELNKLYIMQELLQIKFNHPYLRAKLIETGAAILIEGNNWNDKFWGCTLQHGHWIGDNHLGKLLMEVRSRMFA